MLADQFRVLVTGAAGQVCKSLTMLLASGSAFGPQQPLILHLYDLPGTEDLLEGIAMELMDLVYPLLQDVVVTTDPTVAFYDISVAILAGAAPRKHKMVRKDLISVNGLIFCEYGHWLDTGARKTCKVVVLANPPNTLAYICMHSAPSIPRENFVGVNRLDYNRCVSMLAWHMKVPPSAIKNVIVWGNHSETAYPDASHASITINNVTKRVTEVMNDEMKYMRGPLIHQVIKRGARLIETRQVSSSISAAKATCDILQDWFLGTRPGHLTSLAILSDGWYGAPKDVFFSLPVEVHHGRWVVAKSLKLDEFSKQKIEATGKELLQERAEAMLIIERQQMLKAKLAGNANEAVAEGGEKAEAELKEEAKADQLDKKAEAGVKVEAKEDTVSATKADREIKPESKSKEALTEQSAPVDNAASNIAKAEGNKKAAGKAVASNKTMK